MTTDTNTTLDETMIEHARSEVTRLLSASDRTVVDTGDNTVTVALDDGAEFDMALFGQMAYEKRIELTLKSVSTPAQGEYDTTTVEVVFHPHDDYVAPEHRPPEPEQPPTL